MHASPITQACASLKKKLGRVLSRVTRQGNAWPGMYYLHADHAQVGSLSHSLLLHGSNFFTELDIFGDGFHILVKDPYQDPHVLVRRPLSNDYEQVWRPLTLQHEQCNADDNRSASSKGPCNQAKVMQEQAGGACCASGPVMSRSIGMPMELWHA